MNSSLRTREVTFKSHIYDRTEVERDTTNWALVLLPLPCALLGYLLTYLNGTLGAALIILGVIVVFVNVIREWGQKEPAGKYIGQLILTGDTFTIDKEIIRTSDLDDLKIEISYFKGDKHWHRYGYSIDSGTRSSLEFKINGVKRQVNFLLLSESQLKDLRSVLDQLYTKGIFIKEFYLGERTYLLEYLDYEDIQEFKKTYGLIQK